MSCQDCKTAQDGVTATFARVGNGNVEIIACKVHTLMVLNAINAFKDLFISSPVPTVRAHVMTEEAFRQYGLGGKAALMVRQEVKDLYKGMGYTGVDVYSPGEELLFRVSY